MASTINGGGKTHYIMKRIAEQQSSGVAVAYRRLPVRESTTTSRLVDLLLAAEAYRPDAGRETGG